MAFTKKQEEVLKCFIEEDPRTMVLYGAQRAGKTFVGIILFLSHMMRFEGMNLDFIIAAADIPQIHRNIITTIEGTLGLTLRINRKNSFKLFGNTVHLFGGKDSDSAKPLRGFTAAGAYINEATTCHKIFLDEVSRRCSYPGARMFFDTNPDDPSHVVKTQYVDRDGELLPNGKLAVRAFKFRLRDNETLNDEYVLEQEARCGSGVFYERFVLGEWAVATGIIYKDFDREKHFITKDQLPKPTYPGGKPFARYVAGVDWGIYHNGVILVFGVTKDDTWYMLEEISTKDEDVNFWVEKAVDISKRYPGIYFWCDSGRTDNIKVFKKRGLKALRAYKNVVPGIEAVAGYIKSDRLKIVEENCPGIEDEIMVYRWSDNPGEEAPEKENDDRMDAMRYAMYSEYVQTRPKPKYRR